MKHTVPYYSQFADVTRQEWKSKACTVTCLKMAIEYATGKETTSVDTFIDVGVIIGAHTGHGWDHSGIAILAHNYGVPAYKEEFRSVKVNTETKEFSKSQYEEGMCEYGISKIVKVLDEGGLAIVSVLRGLKPDGGFHSILITGYEKSGEDISFIFHDPDTESGEKSNMTISKTDFIPVWRKMAIFISQNNI